MKQACRKWLGFVAKWKKPNPMLTSADFALLQNPTYESGWRYGTSLGYSKISKGRGFGVNEIGRAHV